MKCKYCNEEIPTKNIFELANHVLEKHPEKMSRMERMAAKMFKPLKKEG